MNTLKYRFRTTKTDHDEYIVEILLDTDRRYGWLGNMGRGRETWRVLQERWPGLEFLKDYKIKFTSEAELMMFLLKNND
jgi:hypothetical protein